MDNAGARGARVLLDAAPSADVLEPPVGAGGGDLLHGVQAEIAAVGKDRGAQRAHVPGVDPRLAWPLEVDAAPEVVLDLDEQVGEPDRATAGVQPAVQVDQAVRGRQGGVLSAGSVFSCHPSSSNTTCRLSGTPWRNRSNASDRRGVQCSPAGAGSPGNPVRAQNALRTGSHCARGRKNASKRPTCFAPSMARLPVWISSCTVRNTALAQRRRSVSPLWRMSGCSAVGAKSSGASGGTPRRPAARCAR